MKPNTSAAPADPVLLALLGGWLAAEALAALLIAAAALLLTLCGWRPATRSKADFRDAIHGAPHGAPKTTGGNHPHPIPAPVAQLAGLRVVGLRRLARAAGLPQLARSGRRAQLLAAPAA